MAQSLTNKVRKLAAIYNIDLIIQTAIDVRNALLDEQAWSNLTDDQKTNWFLDQCKKYNLTTSQHGHQIIVNELRAVGNHNGSKAYFTVFLPREEIIGSDELSDWRLEIGGAYNDYKINGGFWTTAEGLKGKEQQIAEVMRLHALGQ